MNKKSCTICKKLGEECEVGYLIPLPGEKGEEYKDLPKEFYKLEKLDSDLEPYFKSQYEPMDLLICHKCDNYYHYRERTPGGSEDAMRTYVYQTVERIDKKELKKLLKSALKEIKREWWGKNYKKDIPKVKAAAEKLLEELK
ncbi:hypothetical protein HOG48_03045 [Candidatus Peregrinibacteria bacterium]|jgi:hypothetical protein|nr:hypothetical protein [Candidatus Peregrinibacteria bacterium]